MREDEKKPQSADRRGLSDNYRECQIERYIRRKIPAPQLNLFGFRPIASMLSQFAAAHDYSLEMRA